METDEENEKGQQTGSMVVLTRSGVEKVRLTLAAYRAALEKVLHPAGFRCYPEWLYGTDADGGQYLLRLDQRTLAAICFVEDRAYHESPPVDLTVRTAGGSATIKISPEGAARLLSGSTGRAATMEPITGEDASGTPFMLSLHPDHGCVSAVRIGKIKTAGLTDC